MFNVGILYYTNLGFAQVDTVTAGNVMTIGTFFGLIIGFLFFGEIPIYSEIAGVLLIVDSIILLNTTHDKT